MKPNQIVALESRALLIKIVFYKSNPYKIEAILTFLIEMLDLQSFGRMITSTI